MKTINVEITGTSPLLMNKLDVATLQEAKGKVKKTYTVKEMAEKAAYWGTGKKKELIIPSVNLFSSMLGAASFIKVAGGRNAKSIMAGTVRVEPFEISLGTDKYEIDIRAVNNKGSRIVVGRPKLEKWKASFKIVYNEEFIQDEVLKTALGDAGIRIGLMSYRPKCSGPFGCFKVTKWKAA